MTSPQSLTSLSDFLNEFQAFESDTRLKYISVEMNEIDFFLSGFRSAEAKDAIAVKKTAPQYNLFQVLKIGHLETRVHSPFLAHLLNPTATHGQSRLFLNEFLRHLEFHSHIEEMTEVEIRMEHKAENGVFDIFLRYKVKGRAWCILVENKIYAGDQNKQLERYIHNLEQTFSVDGRFLLIYLTIDGRLPSNESISAKQCQELIEIRKLICLSYQRDIADMLQRCLPDCDAPVVQNTIRQYLNTINSL